VYVTYSGTQRGQFGPYPPSNRHFAIPFIGILRLERGKIAEMWVEWDNLNILSQLGLFPPTSEGNDAGQGS
jgi:predicted ester cyclase